MNVQDISSKMKCYTLHFISVVGHTRTSAIPSPAGLPLAGKDGSATSTGSISESLPGLPCYAWPGAVSKPSWPSQVGRVALAGGPEATSGPGRSGTYRTKRT